MREKSSQWAYARRGRRKGGQNRMMVLLTKSYMDFLGKSFRAWCSLLRLRKIHSIGVRMQTVRASDPFPVYTSSITALAGRNQLAAMPRVEEKSFRR